MAWQSTTPSSAIKKQSKTFLSLQICNIEKQNCISYQGNSEGSGSNVNYHHAGVEKAAQRSKSIPVRACGSGGERSKRQTSIRENPTVNVLPAYRPHKEKVAGHKHRRQQRRWL